MWSLTTFIPVDYRNAAVGGCAQVARLSSPSPSATVAISALDSNRDASVTAGGLATASDLGYHLLAQVKLRFVSL
jgi:hypothetical protein